MSKDIKLGTKPAEGALRDAIHVAIAPMIAGTQLAPGAHVGILPDGTAGMSDHPIGIVDPFSGKVYVYKGERFWLLLYQNTVTGMRHHWSHPAFPVESPKPCGEKELSEMWLKVYVREHCPYDKDESDGGYSNFINRVNHYKEIFYHGTDCHNLEDVEDSEELFWHLSVVLGKRIDASYFDGAFSCSC